MSSAQSNTSVRVDTLVPADASFFCFDAQQIGRAISFHLIDLGQARRISNQSLQRTITRLGKEPKGLTISRGVWSSMSDPQRLNWLLEESHTVVELTGDKTALLRAAR